MKKILKKQSGQSTLEFIFTLVICLGFLSLFVSVALTYVSGYVVHYATFMTSRVFLTQDSGSNDALSAISAAKATAANFHARYPLKALGVREGVLQFNLPNEVPIYEYVGAVYTYKSSISGSGIVGGTDFKLMSESFLGKEPTRADCRCQVENAMKGTCQGSFSTSTTEDLTLYDNGC